MDLLIRQFQLRRVSAGLCLSITLLILLGYQNSVMASVWCDEWSQNSYRDFAQLVSIESGGYHFCGGMAVDANWVLSSYSCIQNMMIWQKNVAQLKKSMEQKQDGCFEIYSEIQINSIATDNCEPFNDVDSDTFASTVEYGIQYPQFQEMGIPNLFEPNVSIPVFTNDLILLKLRTPLDWIKNFNIDISADPIPQKIKNNQVELITWQLQKPNGSNEEPIPSVLMDFSQYGLQCEKMLEVFYKSDILDEQEKQFVQLFGEQLYCMQYSVPVIRDNRCRTYHAGDPVVMKQNNNIRLLGMLTEGFVHPHIRDGLQPNDDDNRHYCYSQEDVGDPHKFPEQAGLLMFLAFNQEQVLWINETISGNNKAKCRSFRVIKLQQQQAEKQLQEILQEEEDQGRHKTTHLGVILGVLSAVVVVLAIGILLLYKFKRGKVREIMYVSGITRRGSLGRARRYSSFRDSTEDTDTSKELQLKRFPSRDSNEGESNGNEIQLRPIASRDLEDKNSILYSI